MPIEDKTVLTPTQVDQELSTIIGWKRKESLLLRDFLFSNFKDITFFLNHLVKTITEQNHHPDFTLNTEKKTISIAVTTHSKKGITQADLLFVKTLNSWKPGS
ncbi:MAG: 4a-hydroxytetrahydrobiopterin dehydratase [Planctomycetota bacterium]